MDCSKLDFYLLLIIILNTTLMNKKLLLSTAIIASSIFAQAQQNKFTYAITGDGNKDFIWMNIRQVDLSSGRVTKTLFERSKTEFLINDALTNKSISQTSFTNENVFNDASYPTGTFVAAAALDARRNKLFFTPMRKGELRWMDLNSNPNTPEFHSVAIPNFKNVDPNDEATNITRMVIGADGNGYAISNDANHFFKFTTGKKTVITELGNIIDAETNSGISIHNKCGSWGGDMIADAFGKLYVISASHNVFVIDVNTRIATYKGNISGLPAAYTTNAAAVNENGEVVLASATQFDGYYVCNMNDLKAVKMEGSDTKYNSSDFANGNLLLQKEANSLLNGKITPIATTNSDAKVYPNPVTNASFNVLFENKPAGKYNIIVCDLAGRVVMVKNTQVTEGVFNQEVKLNKNVTKGIYIVKVTDEKNTSVINEKIIIQ